MSNFHIGQEIVCVDDRYTNDRYGATIRAGTKYTIAWVGWFDNPFSPDLSCVGVHLEEVQRRRSRSRGADTNIVVPYRATRFRPVRKTSIEVFEAMLIKAPERVS
jgi:hypothetical protein